MVYLHTEEEFQVSLPGRAKPFRVRPLSYKDWLTMVNLEARLSMPDTPVEEKHAITLQMLSLQVVNGNGEKPLDEILTFAGVQELMRRIAEASALMPEDKRGFPSPHGPEAESCAAPASSPGTASIRQSPDQKP